MRDVSPPQVVDFTGTSTLFNWLGARRVAAFMEQSRKLIVENIESFVHGGMTNLMANERRCMPLRNYGTKAAVATAAELEWVDATGLEIKKRARLNAEEPFL